MADQGDHSPEDRSQALQTYILTPVEGADSPSEPVLDLGRLIQGLWRWKWAILAVPLVFASVLFFYRSSGREAYVATATLLVQSSPLANELEPQSLGLETYQTLLESDTVLMKLKNLLLEESLLPPSTTVESLKKRLQVELVANKAVDRAGQRSYLPMLRLVARFHTPEIAERTANSWASLSVEEARELSRLRKSDALQFVEERYPHVAETLTTVESKLNSTSDEYASEVLRTRTTWQNRILETRLDQNRQEGAMRARIIRKEREFEAETDQMVTDHRLETERSKRDFLNSWQRDLQEDERSLKRRKLAEFKDRLLDVQMKIEEERAHLKELEEEIAKHPEFVVLSKAISDEALWQKVGESSKNSNLRDLANVKFESESLNPVYQRLLGDLTTAKVGLNTLVPNAAQLRDEIAALEKEVVTLDDDFSAKKLEFESLVSRRENELQSLLRKRQAELNILRQSHQRELRELTDTGAIKLAQLEEQRDNVLESVTRDGELAVEQLNREADNAKQTYELIADKLESARLASSDELADVQLGVPAARPEEPEDKQAALWAVAGFVIGLIAVLSLVILFEVGRSYFPDEETSPRKDARSPAQNAAGSGVVPRELPSSGRS